MGERQEDQVGQAYDEADSGGRHAGQRGCDGLLVAALGDELVRGGDERVAGGRSDLCGDLLAGSGAARLARC
jgi:hypothetical protein